MKFDIELEITETIFQDLIIDLREKISDTLLDDSGLRLEYLTEDKQNKVMKEILQEVVKRLDE